MRESTSEQAGNLGGVPPLAVAVAGASGSGKSMLVGSLSRLLDHENVAHFDLDGYHWHTREERRQLQEFPEELRSNNFERIVHDLELALSGHSIDMPTYDHSIGAFSSPIRLAPRPILFVEGLHAAMLNEISGRKLIDVSVFTFPDEELRQCWKVGRDVRERGYQHDDAARETADREPFVVEHVLPQMSRADIVLRSSATDKKGHVKHKILLLPRFVVSSAFGEGPDEHVLGGLSLEEAEWGGCQCSEAHLQNESAILKSLQDGKSRLGLKGTMIAGLRPTERYSYSEATRTLSVLILAVAVGRHDDELD